MNTTVQQKGLSLVAFLVGALIFVIVAIFGLKLIPAYMQDAKIVNLFNAIKHDPDMARASINEIRASFAKRSVIDSITAITPEQVDMTDAGVLISHYSVSIPLVGNASLLLDFNPQSGS